SWMDTASTGVMSMTGKWDATGKVMTWSGTMVDPMTNKPAKLTQKVTIVDNDHHNWEMWGPDMTGKTYKMMEASYTRAKGHGQRDRAAVVIPRKRSDRGIYSVKSS